MNLTTTLSPSFLTVSNTSAGTVPDYLFSGTGGLTGNMSLSRTGNGTLTLSNSGTNDYTGDTAIRTGTIKLGADDVLSSASVLRIGGSGSSLLNMAGFSAEIAGLQSVAANTRRVDSAAPGSTLTINVTTGESYTYGSNFAGGESINLTKTGEGSQTFTRAGGLTTDVGDIAANGGTLIWSVNRNNGTVSIAASSILQIGSGGAVGSIGTGAAGTIGDKDISNDGELVISRSDAVSYANLISGSGGLRTIGTGTLTLNTAQTYNGGTTIFQGIIQSGIDNALPATTVLTVGGSGGLSAFELDGNNQTVGGLTQADGTKELRNNNPTASTFTINTPDGESFFYASNIQGSGVINFVKDGLGTQEMTRASGYSTAPGDLSVNAGTLIWDVNDSYGDVAVNSAGNLSLSQSGTAASFTAASGSATTFNWQITDWTGVAGTAWPQLTVTGDLSIAGAGPAFAVVVTEDSLANFSDVATDFTIATIGGTLTAVPTNLTLDASGFTSGAGSWSLNVVGQDLVLSYTPPEGDAYDTWASGFGVVGGFDDDDEKDTVDNGLEFILGGNPGVSDPEVLPDGETNVSGELVFTFNRNDDALGITTLTFQYGNDLTGWSDVNVPAGDFTDGNGVVVDVTEGVGTDVVEITVPNSLVVDGKIFGRLAATRP